MKDRTVKILAAIIVVMLSAASCAVHEWPEELPANATLKLDFNTALPQFLVMDLNQGTRVSKDGKDYEIRYVIEAYRKLSGGGYDAVPYKRFTFTKADVSDLNHEVTINIDEGTYMFYVWTDFVEKGTAADYFYDTRSFREITMRGEHEGNNDFRDAFVGHNELTVTRYGSMLPPVSGTINMERPLAKFEFITTDLQEFITKVITEMNKKKENEDNVSGELTKGEEDADDGTKAPDDTKGDGDSKSPIVDLKKYNVVFYYTGYMPSKFNMWDDKPNDSSLGVQFRSDITLIDEHNARLGFDYVLVNGKESSVMVAVGLFDEEGTRLSMTNQIEVPIKRSMLTTVKGSFLMQDTGGGVAIDPDFEGEFNIIIK